MNSKKVQESAVIPQPFRAKPGFNLIEIIVALAIVTIMAVGALGAFRFIQTGKMTKTEAELTGLRLDLENYRNDTGSYPASLDDLVKKPASAKGWRGPYRDDLPQDGWRQPFEYMPSAKGATHPYELYSYGKNGPGAPEDEWVSVWNQQ